MPGGPDGSRGAVSTSTDQNWLIAVAELKEQIVQPRAGWRDWPWYVFALVCGAGIGYLHLRLGELALAALLVSIATMFLGAVRPRWPWRWALLVALCVPLAMLAAHLGRERFSRGAVFGSFALLMPSLACAYGGSFLRRLMGELFPKS